MDGYKKIKLIVEAGCNWKDLEEAKEFIIKAKEIDAWACKFQAFNEAICEQAKLPKCLILNKYDLETLIQCGKDEEIEVFFSVMYPECIDWLEQIGVNYYKIRFKDFKESNYELIKRVLSTDKPFFVSADAPINSLIGIRSPRMKVLFCVPEYPAKHELYIKEPKHLFYDGISDHTSDTGLIIHYNKEYLNDFYFEKHVKLNDDCIESKWSVSFEQLKEALER